MLLFFDVVACLLVFFSCGFCFVVFMCGGFLLVIIKKIYMSVDVWRVFCAYQINVR